jgi:predicted DNA binding CopG/RHH family protein
LRPALHARGTIFLPEEAEPITGSITLDKDMGTVSNWEDVPIFDSEEAEASFWGENSVDVRLMESSVAASSESTESVTITLRIDPRMLARIKRLARERYLNYQSMIKQWLSERMEQEFKSR